MDIILPGEKGKGQRGDTMNIEHVYPRQIGEWVLDRVEKMAPEYPVLPILFGGDRLTCCDEAYVYSPYRLPFGTTSPEGLTHVGYERTCDIVGGVTISKTGQDGQGPEIVGLYVIPEYRRRGYGDLLLKIALLRLEQLDLLPARIHVLSTACQGLVANLQSWFKERLTVVQESNVLDMLIEGGDPDAM